MNFEHDANAPLQVIEIESTLEAARAPEQLILRELSRCGYREEAIFDIQLALAEAFANAVKHGNRGDRSKRITVSFAVTPQRTVICVQDQGAGFQPSVVPDPTQPGRRLRPSGRGIMLMRAHMDEVHYRNGGTEVCLIKRNEQPAIDAKTGA
jgi:serine/threonine-protein kinase RsbW